MHVMTTSLLAQTGELDVTPIGPWDWTLTLAVALVVAGVTLVGVSVTVVQKAWADRRQQLWNRMEWALTMAAKEDENAKTAGLLVMQYLADSNDLKRRSAPPARLTRYDARLLQDVAKALGKKED